MDDAAVADVVALLDRVPAVTDIHTDLTTTSTEAAETIAFPVTLWEDDFWEQEAFADVNQQPSADEKIHQLENILTVYSSGVTVTISVSSDTGQTGTHLVRITETTTANPLQWVRRRLNELWWRYQVWNRRTHIDVTPLSGPITVN